MKHLVVFISVALAAGAEEIRLPCTADTSLCLHPGERALNQGAKTRLRVKGNEHVLLFNFETGRVKGKTVSAARLFVKPSGPVKLKAVGISTVSSDWKEGAQSDAPAAPGESCFLEAARGERPWAWGGSDFLAVAFGAGGSRWWVEEVREEKDGWLSVELAAEAVHAMAEGNSCGLALSDEKGQTRANNDLFSREQSGAGAYLVVEAEDGAAPASGASMWSAGPAAGPAADRTPEFLMPEGPAAEPAAGAFRVLHEGETDASKASSGRLWDGTTITLVSARGDHAAFEISTDRTARIHGDGWSVRRILPVGAALDPLVPDDTGPGLFHVERFIPPDEKPGAREFPIRVGDATVPVRIDVASAVLPAALSFHVSLNTYGSPGASLGARPGTPAFLALERAFHRLAHEHRATLAPLLYSHHGNLDLDAAPALDRDGRIADWSAWDARWSPYFDGTAFAGLPRDAVPLDHFYLALHENWPLPIRDHYAFKGHLDDHWKDAPPIEDAFPAAYAEAFRAAVAATARHVASKNWSATSFHFYLNNKNNYWKPDRNSSWWLLDEPAYRDDFLALRYFGALFREGMTGSAAPLVFRIDLSRPQFRRDYLDGFVGLDVISSVYREYPERVFGRGEAVWTYGSVPAPGQPGQAPRAWVLQAWLDGCDGVVPWQTVGRQDSWTTPEDTAILLPPRPGMPPEPCGTLRLKMLRRGEGDAELLGMLLAKKKWTRAEVRAGLAKHLGLGGEFRKKSDEDAGWIGFGKLDAERFEEVRRAVLKALE